MCLLKLFTAFIRFLASIPPFVPLRGSASRPAAHPPRPPPSSLRSGRSPSHLDRGARVEWRGPSLAGRPLRAAPSFPFHGGPHPRAGTGEGEGAGCDREAGDIAGPLAGDGGGTHVRQGVDASVRCPCPSPSPAPGVGRARGRSPGKKQNNKKKDA